MSVRRKMIDGEEYVHQDDVLEHARLFVPTREIARTLIDDVGVYEAMEIIYSEDVNDEADDFIRDNSGGDGTHRLTISGKTFEFMLDGTDGILVSEVNARGGPNMFRLSLDGIERIERYGGAVNHNADGYVRINDDGPDLAKNQGSEVASTDDSKVRMERSDGAVFTMEKNRNAIRVKQEGHNILLDIRPEGVALMAHWTGDVAKGKNKMPYLYFRRQRDVYETFNKLDGVTGNADAMDDDHETILREHEASAMWSEDGVSVALNGEGVRRGKTLREAMTNG